jgi:hypothetical protein
MSGINPGTNPGNETRIRRLESELQMLTIQAQTMLELLRRNQRYGGGGVVKCSQHHDAKPGSYEGIAGDTITPGSTGPVVFGGNIFNAVNHSQCEVKVGDRVGLHITPNCGAFFVPCVCCESDEPTEPNCCDKFVAVCVAGYTQVVPVSCQEGDPWGPTATWSLFPLRQCCEAYSDDLCSTSFTINITYLAIKLCCVDGVITAYYGVTCGFFPEEDSPGSGTWDWSALCDEPPGVINRDLVLQSEDDNVCALRIVASATASSDLCEPCDPEPPAPDECCDQSLYFCLNGVSVLLAVDGGTYTWDVSACCGTTASFQITLSCNPSTGNISLSYLYTAGEVTAAGTENTIMSQFCNDGAPRIINFTLPCFLQLLVSQVQFECSECTGGESPTVSPPPPP